MKKFLSLVLALVMTMSLVTVSAGAKDFTDSSKINYAEAVDVLSEAKVIDGYADGAFNPSNTLTRGAAAKIICNLILGPTTASALVADAAAARHRGPCDPCRLASTLCAGPRRNVVLDAATSCC